MSKHKWSVWVFGRRGGEPCFFRASLDNQATEQIMSMGEVERLINFPPRPKYQKVGTAAELGIEAQPQSEVLYVRIPAKGGKRR